MFELFKLVGRVMVDASGANQALEGTDKKAQGVTGNLGGYMDKLKDWAKAAGAAIASSAIAKAVKEVWDISSQVAAVGDNIDKASQRFLMSAQAYQEWDYIAKMSGTTIESVGAAVYELSKKVAEGGDETLALLEEIGVSAADAMTATPEDLFSMVVAGLQNVEDIGRRAYISDALMGGSAQELETIFNSTQDALKELVDEMKSLGVEMSDELRKMSSEFTDSKTKMNAALDGVKNHLAEKTLPGMTQIVDGLTQMLTGDFKGGLETAADGVYSYLTGLLSAFDAYWQGIANRIQEAQYTVGGWFGMTKEEVEAGVDAYYNDEFQLPSGEWVTQDELDDRFRHASGIEFVPRNDYPATLHYGERVLTRQEAEEYNAGKVNGGNITINITTTSQSPAQTAAAVAAALTRARWAM